MDALAGITFVIGFFAGSLFERVFGTSVHFASMSDRQLRILSDLHSGKAVTTVFDGEVVDLAGMGLVGDPVIGDVVISEFEHRLELTAKGRRAIMTQPLSWMRAERRINRSARQVDRKREER